jgi:hypothetical protein
MTKGVSNCHLHAFHGLVSVSGTDEWGHDPDTGGACARIGQENKGLQMVLAGVSGYLESDAGHKDTISWPRLSSKRSMITPVAGVGAYSD